MMGWRGWLGVEGVVGLGAAGEWLGVGDRGVSDGEATGRMEQDCARATRFLEEGRFPNRPYRNARQPIRE